RLLVFFYQDGCPYCEKLVNVNFSQKSIVDKTRQNFDVVAINMWGDREVSDFGGKHMTEKEFATSQRIMFTPTLLFLNEKGEVALRLNGYIPPAKFTLALDYIIQRQENIMRFSDFLKANLTALSSGEIHNVDYFRSGSIDLSRRKSDADYLMILFEQKQCPACDELHRDILKRPETEVLARKFDVVQLDMWSNKSMIDFDGTKMTVKDFTRKLNVKYTPGFVFFDKNNNEIIRIEAYLKSFHIQSVMDYVLSGAYKTEPSFQRYIDVRANALRDKGVKVELMK
ncbi:MAG: thioredoxin fold domain-containing protein, partial [Gammaproteobacteria bacterium]|nr:thioredoxin fold domain-containing protein [Gammaproteobacteria bacterium]